MEKIYLAIPYSGMAEHSFKTANKVAAELMNLGFIVFSPISHSHPIASQCSVPGDWSYWEKFDTEFLKWCDKVIVVKLKGWEKSKGVAAEISIANDLNKPVEYLDWR